MSDIEHTETEGRMNAPDLTLRMAAERDQLDQIETLIRRYLDNNGELATLLNEVGDAVEMTKHKSFAHKLHRLAVDALNYESLSDEAGW